MVYWEHFQQNYCYFLNVFNINFNLFLIYAALLKKGVLVTIRSDLCSLWHL